jgi:aspartyl-tRNA synthetase
MNRNLIKELPGRIGETVTLAGWAQKVRFLKRRQFVVLRDHTGTVQLFNEDNEEVEEVIRQLTNESTVIATGVVTANPGVKAGGFEVVLQSLQLVTSAESMYPLGETAASEDRLDWRFLDLRKPANHLIFRVQTTVEQAMREYWIANGFIEIHSPKFMASPSESGAELFTVDYFDRKAFLAQSPQFYKQMAMAAGFDRVFEIGPVFRANPSRTSRHDTEFTSVDMEISWIDSHHEVMDWEEAWLRHVLEAVQSQHGDAIRDAFGVEVVVPELPFPRVTMAEAYQILDRVGYTVTRAEKGDLDPEGERTLARYIKENYGHEFVFVTDYPTTVRPFYHMRQDDQPNLTRSFDLIWKGLEVTTGAQREHRYDRLVAQAKEKGLTEEGLRHYLDFFRFGVPPHGGYGFGLTRMLMTILGLGNVREVTYLYRGMNRLTP